jgi:predicted amidohydrolase YtcJ
VRMAASVLGPQDRIEHAQHIHPDDLTRLAQAGCTACVNPSHMEVDWQAAERMLPNQGRGSYPLASLLGAGVPIVFGSDAPVAEANPLHAMMWAVQRADQQGHPPGGWQPQEKIRPDQALAASTHLAANACLADGTHVMAKGKAADLMALDGDPFETPPEQWPRLQVKKVWLEGQPVL